MSVFLQFPNGEEWNVTNREFSRLVMRHCLLFPDDVAVREDLKLIGAVGFRSLNPDETGSKILRALHELSRRIVAHTDDALWKGDPDLETHDDSVRIYEALLVLTSTTLGEIT
jgi:hypothetical protein